MNKPRRKLLKSIAAGSGVVITGKSLPESWLKPVVSSVILPAHAQTSTDCPIFTTTTDWYETSPQTVLSTLGQIQLIFTLRNDTGSNFVLNGTFDMWSEPNVINPPTFPVVVNSSASGTITPGSTFSYDLTIDLSGLPATEVTLAIRPFEFSSLGLIRPDIASIVSSTSTCG